MAAVALLAAAAVLLLAAEVWVCHRVLSPSPVATPIVDVFDEPDEGFVYQPPPDDMFEPAATGGFDLDAELQAMMDEFGGDAA